MRFEEEDSALPMIVRSLTENYYLFNFKLTSD